MATGSKGYAGINVTPLIDVLLVLLIIFMVITPLKSRGFGARIPQPAPPDAMANEDPSATREIVIRIARAGEIEVNSQPVTIEGLAEKIRPALRPGATVFVQGAGSLEFREIAAVLDAAREGGAGAFAFIPFTPGVN